MSFRVEASVALYDSLMITVSGQSKHGKDHIRFALRADEAAKTHRDGSSDKLGQAAKDDQPSIAKRREAGREGEGDSQSIGEANDGIRDHARTWFKSLLLGFGLLVVDTRAT